VDEFELVICDCTDDYDRAVSLRDLKRATKKALEFAHSKVYFAHLGRIVQDGALQHYKVRQSEHKELQVQYVPKRGEEDNERVGGGEGRHLRVGRRGKLQGILHVSRDSSLLSLDFFSLLTT
jgi:hypothetical protein